MGKKPLREFGGVGRCRPVGSRRCVFEVAVESLANAILNSIVSAHESETRTRVGELTTARIEGCAPILLMTTPRLLSVFPIAASACRFRTPMVLVSHIIKEILMRMRDHILNNIVSSIPLAHCTSPSLANEQTVASVDAVRSRSRRCRGEKRIAGDPPKESITTTVLPSPYWCSLL